MVLLAGGGGGSGLAGCEEIAISRAHARLQRFGRTFIALILPVDSAGLPPPDSEFVYRAHPQVRLRGGLAKRRTTYAPQQQLQCLELFERTTDHARNPVDAA